MIITTTHKSMNNKRPSSACSISKKSIESITLSAKSKVIWKSVRLISAAGYLIRVTLSKENGCIKGYSWQGLPFAIMRALIVIFSLKSTLKQGKSELHLPSLLDNPSLKTIRNSRSSWLIFVMLLGSNLRWYLTQCLKLSSELRQTNHIYSQLSEIHNFLAIWRCKGY